MPNIKIIAITKTTHPIDWMQLKQPLPLLFDFIIASNSSFFAPLRTLKTIFSTSEIDVCNSEGVTVIQSVELFNTIFVLLSSVYWRVNLIIGVFMPLGRENT